ncbi:MAG: hypothetical protein WC797_00205 [Candidatus Paceibacterota bacterium]|jgi:hypothetical protein
MKKIVVSSLLAAALLVGYPANAATAPVQVQKTPVAPKVDDRIKRAEEKFRAENKAISNLDKSGTVKAEKSKIIEEKLKEKIQDAKTKVEDKSKAAEAKIEAKAATQKEKADEKIAQLKAKALAQTKKIEQRLNAAADRIMKLAIRVSDRAKIMADTGLITAEQKTQVDQKVQAISSALSVIKVNIASKIPTAGSIDPTKGNSAAARNLAQASKLIELDLKKAQQDVNDALRMLVGATSKDKAQTSEATSSTVKEK